jgi:hypothetical protein
VRGRVAFVVEECELLKATIFHNFFTVNPFLWIEVWRLAWMDEFVILVFSINWVG